MTRREPEGIEAVMDRVAKLLRLASSDNPHEATMAAARAHELMARYAIDQATLELEAPEEGREEIADFSSSDPLDAAAHNFPRWKLTLLSVLCGAHQAVGTLTHTPAGKQIGIVGRPSDVAKVRYMYAWLTNEIGELSAFAGKGRGRTWNNNFRVGFVEGLATQLREATARARAEARDAAASSTALVRVENAIEHIDAREREVAAWMKQHRSDWGHVRADSRATPDFEARFEGRQAGSRFDLKARTRLGPTR